MVASRPSLSASLHWVRSEMELALVRARTQIEQYIEAPDDKLPLQQASMELNQVRGTATVIQCAGVAVVAAEMIAALRELVDDSVTERDAAFGALMGAAVQLGDYIDALASGQDDCLLVFQPAINELRLARGLAVATEAELFAEHLLAAHPEVPVPASEARQPGQVQVAAQKFLPVFQQALLAWFKDQDVQPALSRMGKIGEQLAGMSCTAPSYQLWRVFAGAVEALLGHALEPSMDLKRLMGRAGQFAKRIASDGEEAIAADAEPLAFQILFHVGRSRGQGPRVTFLRRAYQLESRLPSETALDGLRQRLRGPNTVLLNKLSSELRADLTEVKDAIDLIVRAGERAPDDLVETLARLRRIADTLNMLGLSTLQRVVQNQAALVQNLRGEGEAAGEHAWMDAATSLLRVEHSLDEALFRQLRQPQGAGGQPQYEEQVPHSADLREGVQALLRETLVNISRLKTQVDSFLRTGNAGGLDEAARLLGETRSAFRILDSARASELSGELLRFLRHADFRRIRANPEQADRFADAIACIEYYLEARKEGRPDTDQLLDDLAGYVERLDFSDDAVDTPAEAPATAAPPAAETIDPPAADEIDPEIRAVFLEEAVEVQQTLARSLPPWRRDPENTEHLLEIRRAFHTLKGSGRMVGASLIGEFGWAIEQLLNRCRDGAIAVTPDIVALVSEAIALLPALIDSFRDEQPPPEAVTPLMERAQALTEGPAEPDMLAVFREDAGGHLDRIAAWLRRQDRSDIEFPVDQDVVRGLHTLRGSAAVVEARGISQLAGALETYLDSVRGAGLKLQGPALELLDEAVGELRGWLEQPEAVQDEPAQWLERIEAVQKQVPEEAVQAASDRQLADVFALEALDLVKQIESTAEAWAAQPDAPYHVRTLRSLFQTLRGAAVTAQCAAIGNVALAFESRLSAYDDDAQAPTAAFFDALRARIEELYQVLDAFRDGRLDDDGAELAARVFGLDISGTAAEGLPAAVGETASPEAPAAAESEAPPPAERESALEFLPTETISGWTSPAELPERDDELVEIFVAEAEEILEELDRQLDRWERAPALHEPLGELARGLHTLKGSARMAGLLGIGEVAHRVESLLGETARGHRERDASFFGRLHNTVDGLYRVLDDVRAQRDPDVEPLFVELEDVEADAETELDVADAAGIELVDLAERPTREAEGIELLEIDEALLPESPADAPAQTPPPESARAPSADEDAELLEVFRDEAAELLELLDTSLRRWRKAPDDTAARLDAQRALHTLKGGANMAGLAAMGAAVHEMESLVDDVERGELEADEGMFDQLGTRLEQLQHMHDRLARGDAAELADEPPFEPPQFDEPLPSLPPEGTEGADIGAPSETEAAAPEAAAAVPEPTPPAVAPEPDLEGGWDPALFWRPSDEGEGLLGLRRELARVPVERLDTMLNEAGEISIYRSRLEQHNSGLQNQLAEVAETINRIREQLRLMDIETEAQIAARGLTQSGESTDDRYAADFDPLEMDRYSRMQELSRALSESINDLASLHQTMDESVSEAETLLMQQGRINTEVQQGLMGTLMVPFSRQVQRLQRVVKQVAQETGKQAEIRFDGIEAELDRNVLERMTAPMEHLLRNAVVHGIELPADRREAGKPEAGRIDIRLWRDGTQLVIDLADDGRGLHFSAIRAKAVERGLMPEGANLSDSQVAQFIFEPGFSTASTLTQAAGRGVGMDVVAAEVKQLGGTLDLASEPGRGARFTIRLPLTLAISQALMVSVGGETYAVPLSSIEGIARIPRDKLASYYDPQGPQLDYGGNQYRVRYLGEYLGTRAVDSEDSRTVPAILVRLAEGMRGGERRGAVVVDALLGNREVVSKSVGPQVSSVVGITGATIMADGNVVLILDIPALVQDRTRRQLIAEAQAGAHEESATDERATVMVVDDSITMRRVAERLLTRNGYRVVTAKDGLDAMAQLATETPAAILLDIEMPRADGFEVATFVRNTDRIRRVPIIMITSRSGDKHRERARSIGVDRYLIKPYQEDQLLSEIRGVIAERLH